MSTCNCGCGQSEPVVYDGGYGCCALGARGPMGPTGPTGATGATGTFCAKYSTTESPTGATFNGKPVFRQLWNINITAPSNTQDDTILFSTAGYVDSIVDAGGNWSTGNGTERYMLGSANATPNPLYAFVLVGTSNQLVLRTCSSQNRTGAPVMVWVDYTKA